MAIIRNTLNHTVSGKMNKKSNEVNRVRNGKQFVYSIEKEYEDNPSAAQKVQRANFGKTNAILNLIMADPEQVKEWEAKMKEYNRQVDGTTNPAQRRFETVRAFAYYVISEQQKRKPAARRRKAALSVLLPKDVKPQVKRFVDLTATELYEILKARFSVFVGEQHIHYLDEDNIDYLAIHFSLRKNGRVLAYARLFNDAEKNVMRIGRMLTIERGKEYGRYLMERMIDEARRQGATKLNLHAQMQAVPFYQHLGFQIVGEPFIEAELPHVEMEFALS